MADHSAALDLIIGHNKTPFMNRLWRVLCLRELVTLQNLPFIQSYRIGSKLELITMQCSDCWVTWLAGSRNLRSCRRLGPPTWFARLRSPHIKLCPGAADDSSTAAEGHTSLRTGCSYDKRDVESQAHRSRRACTVMIPEADRPFSW